MGSAAGEGQGESEVEHEHEHEHESEREREHESEGEGAGAFASARDPAAERYRRAPAIALFWVGQALAGGSFWHGSALGLAPRDAWILDQLGAYQTAAEAACVAPPEGLAPIAPADLERLAEAFLLERESAPHADARRFVEHWQPWGFATQCFHAAAREVRYVEDNAAAAEVHRAMVEQAAPPPSPVKRYPGAPRVALPRTLPPLSVPLEVALASRRTWRSFTGESIGLAALSKLLLVSFGAVLHADAGEYGHLLYKTSPSGGARHPTECYVAALAVEGVAPGLYHYDPLGHALEEIALVEADALAAQVNGWLANQVWFQGSAVVVWLSAIPSRLWFKYKHGRGYRALLLDQGHVGQTFCLAATAIGLGPWQTAAIKDAEIERALGLDGVEEAIFYALGCGVTTLPSLFPGAAVEPWGERPPRQVAFPEPPHP